MNSNKDKLSKMSSYDLVATPPDGGYGWVIVTSSFLLQAIGGGVSFSFGVFFVELLPEFDQGKGATAWIGSINTGLLFGAGRSCNFLKKNYADGFQLETGQQST